MRVLKNYWLWFGLAVIAAAAYYFWLVASQPPLPSLEGQQATRLGSVQILSSPTGAAISIDGTAVSQTSPATVDGLAPGKHTVKLSLSGYQDVTSSVIIPPGQSVWSDTELTSQ